MIRPATIADKARVIGLLRNAAPAAFGELIPFDPAYAERLFLAHLASDRALCLVHVASEPQGVLMATVSEHPFGPALCAHETLWWIDPAHRGGSAAVRMLQAYEQWAETQNCVFVGMAGMESDPRVAKMYARRGYRHVESHYLKPLRAAA